MTQHHHAPKPVLQLGRVVIMPGVLAGWAIPLQLDFMSQHMRDDWGGVDIEDRETNDNALLTGGRILSAYAIDPAKPTKGYGDNTLWIITEADRSLTTPLLPNQYWRSTAGDTRTAGGLSYVHTRRTRACCSDSRLPLPEWLAMPTRAPSGHFVPADC